LSAYPHKDTFVTWSQVNPYKLSQCHLVNILFEKFEIMQKIQILNLVCGLCQLVSKVNQMQTRLVLLKLN